MQGAKGNEAVETQGVAVPVLGSSVYNGWIGRNMAGFRRAEKLAFEYTLLFFVVLPAVILGVLISLLLFIPSKGKILYRQKRVGKGGSEFTIYKFRTLKSELNMSIEKDKNSIGNSTLFLGKFLRKTGLDELPQLINVMKGEMNIIGPRALLRRDLEFLDRRSFLMRHTVLPGITGLWQLNRRHDGKDIHCLSLDFYYIHNWSLRLDLFIFLHTFLYIIKRRGM